MSAIDAIKALPSPLVQSTSSSARMKLIAIILLIFTAAANAAPDCYYPFLAAAKSCQSGSDCPFGVCIYSLNRMHRVCCEPKEGTIQPVCSSGKPSPLPVLCNPESNDVDICPDGYECRKSSTIFEKSNGEPNYLCCR